MSFQAAKPHTKPQPMKLPKITRVLTLSSRVFFSRARMYREHRVLVIVVRVKNVLFN